jgi:hypothetical protein
VTSRVESFNGEIAPLGKVGSWDGAERFRALSLAGRTFYTLVGDVMFVQAWIDQYLAQLSLQWGVGARLMDCVVVALGDDLTNTGGHPQVAVVQYEESFANMQHLGCAGRGRISRGRPVWRCRNTTEPLSSLLDRQRQEGGDAGRGTLAPEELVGGPYPDGKRCHGVTLPAQIGNGLLLERLTSDCACSVRAGRGLGSRQVAADGEHGRNRTTTACVFPTRPGARARWALPTASHRSPVWPDRWLSAQCSRGAAGVRRCRCVGLPTCGLAVWTGWGGYSKFTMGRRNTDRYGGRPIAERSGRRVPTARWVCAHQTVLPGQEAVPPARCTTGSAT